MTMLYVSSFTRISLECTCYTMGSLTTYLPLAFAWLACLSFQLTNASLRIPFLSRNKYTPLVFFKVPPGLIPECDAMEQKVKEVEKELGVHVERLDILRDPSAEAVLRLLTKRTPPFLYNRESCQVVHMTPRKGESDKDMPIVVDKDRIRAWAKGRYLPAQRDVSKVQTPVVLSQQDNAIDQEDLLEDMALTPLQRKGKQAIRERTEEKAKARAEK